MEMILIVLCMFLTFVIIYKTFDAEFKKKQIKSALVSLVAVMAVNETSKKDIAFFDAITKCISIIGVIYGFKVDDITNLADERIKEAMEIQKGNKGGSNDGNC